jgi:hypothetical protein
MVTRARAHNSRRTVEVLAGDPADLLVARRPVPGVARRAAGGAGHAGQGRHAHCLVLVGQQRRNPRRAAAGAADRCRRRSLHPGQLGRIDDYAITRSGDLYALGNSRKDQIGNGVRGGRKPQYDRPVNDHLTLTQVSSTAADVAAFARG